MSGQPGNLRWIGAAAAAVIVALVVFLLVRGNDDEPAAERELREVDAAGLSDLAATQPHTIFWAGPQGIDRFEWTALPTGEVYVRYLTGDAELDDPRPIFLTVGTYPVGDGLASIRSAAEAPDAETFDIPGGGTAMVNENTPNSVYLAYPDSELQIEVYHPSPEDAREIVENGEIVPVS